MSKKSAVPVTDEQRADLAWLVQPAKDLVENFSIDVLTALSSYLEVIEQECEENEELERQRAANPAQAAALMYKLFNFQRACRVLQGSCQVYARKVDLVYDLTLSVVDLIDNKQGDAGGGAVGRRGKGGRRIVNLGSMDYGLIDVKQIKLEALEGYGRALKEEKSAIESLRSVDLAESCEQQYERKNCLVEKPTQFMFKLNYGQLDRTDEQIWSSKPRPEVIGKVKDFDVKKSEVVFKEEILYSHDCYKNNIDQFTLPGARWIPDNKELAVNFGVPDVEVELDQEHDKELVSAYGPFKDPLSGREVVAPPRWFIEQEATRQHVDLQSRATSRATMAADSQPPLSQRMSSQGTQRLSQPLVERQRNDRTLTQLMTFVDRLAKNRPSTHLATGVGLVDMLVDNYGNSFSAGGGGGDENMNPGGGGGGGSFDYDYGGGGGGGMDYDDDGNDYVANLTRKSQHRRAAPAPWDDLEKARIPHYTGDEDLPATRKAIKQLAKEPPNPSESLRRKRRREAKTPKTRRDEFMETHDYLQDHYYWRSAARINPNKDWKVEALRGSILSEKKRRVREKTAKIREIRAKNGIGLVRRATTRGIAVEEYEAVMMEEPQQPMTIRRTMGAEFDDVVDEDLAAEVELSVLGGGYDAFDDYDIGPESVAAPAAAAEDVAPVSTYKPLRFADMDEDRINNIMILPGEDFINKALPLLRDFAENQTDRELMAYKMAKAYEDVDVAVSTLQAHVDMWHAKMEPILDEGETRKEYDVDVLGQAILAKFKTIGETKRLLDLVDRRPWFEISRYFLSCLFMCNVGNVMISEVEEEIPPIKPNMTEQEIQTMNQAAKLRITLLSRESHREKIREMEGLGGGGGAVKNTE
uniref:CNDH2_N domain-containing protein n=1 Tax=Caenorhabditis tropicalis TaxID=1561998 RepID=A0A1I7TWT7_9PELO